MGSSEQQQAESRHHEGSNQLTPVVKWLLIANIGIYFLDLLFLNHALRDWGKFTVASGLMHGRIWELVTFQFLHWSIGHLVVNCIPLFFFGPWMERWWGSAKFAAFYLICGLAGGLFSAGLLAAGWFDYSPETPMAGASAGIYGILIGVAYIAPSMQVRLLIPPITLTMRQLAIAILVIAIGAVSFQIGGNEGGEAAHLGGAIVGFLLVRHPFSLQWIRGGKLPGARRRPRIPPEKKIRPRTRIQLEADGVVDRILDKISQEGFQSLTDDEREILRKAAESKSSEP
ncbi:MAG: rhomboid family intramembrane serine protease [Luteolibacter sp.]